MGMLAACSMEKTVADVKRHTGKEGSVNVHSLLFQVLEQFQLLKSQTVAGLDSLAPSQPVSPPLAPG